MISNNSFRQLAHKTLVVPTNLQIGDFTSIIKTKNKNMLAVEIFLLTRNASKFFFLRAEDYDSAGDGVCCFIEDLAFHRIVKIGEGIHDGRP